MPSKFENGVRTFFVLAALLTSTGCATTSDVTDARVVDNQLVPDSCLAQLGLNDQSNSSELDSRGINLVNWNIQKGNNPDWVADLAAFADDPHIMLFQEARLDAEIWDAISSDHHRSFAPGYETAESVTGLMTLSSVEPLAQCNLSSVEPWLRSPKATQVTEYALTHTDETLLVVNIHAINFTFGTSDFKEQVNRALEAVNAHQGPVLMSGDFNTWHWRQSGVLQDMAESEGFEVLNFADDHRKRAFGQVLDYIYVRGLQVIDSSTGNFASSDHNPMSVRFSL